MAIFEIYIHGTPKGHQIWGSELNHDYIGSFYSNDKRAKLNAFVQAEICDGNSFYTYLHGMNVYDMEGRPGAFFALTVSFHKAYCSNVYKLYQLFEAVYNQLCTGAIIRKNGDAYNFIVPDFTAARTGGNATVDMIKSAFNQKIEELIAPYLQPLSSEDTCNREKRSFSLLEVDSPMFNDYFKKYSLIISSEIQPVAVACKNSANEVRELTAQKRTLLDANNRLQAEIASLKDANNTLAEQVGRNNAFEDRHQGQIDRLQASLSAALRERDALKEQLNEVSGSIEQLHQPIEHVTRLLAGRFPNPTIPQKEDKSSEDVDAQRVLSDHPSYMGSIRHRWNSGIDRILLFLILIACGVIMYAVLKPTAPEVTKSNDAELVVETEDPIGTQGNTGSGLAVRPNNGEYAAGDSESVASVDYTPWEQCYLNIIGGGENLHPEKPYGLSITKGRGGPLAVVPDGTWQVFIEAPDSLLNCEDSFILDNSALGNKITLQYVVGGEVKISRTCQVN